MVGNYYIELVDNTLRLGRIGYKRQMRTVLFKRRDRIYYHHIPRYFL